MSRTPFPTLSVQPEGTGELSREEGNSVSFSLVVLGESLCFDVAVNRRSARLQDMVPLARTVASRISRATTDSLERAGRTIACTKGCHACCGYMVALSVPEVFRLRQDVQDMPVWQREIILRQSVESAGRILDRRPSRTIGGVGERTDARITVNRISRWYGRLGLPCVFLSDGTCTVYSDRPLVCREHLVEGASESCDLRSSEMPQVVRQPVSVVEAFARLTSELEGLPIESIMLPFALAWAQDNVKRSERTWPALQMVERFFAILNGMTLENAPTDTPAAPLCCR